MKLQGMLGLMLLVFSPVASAQGLLGYGASVRYAVGYSGGANPPDDVAFSLKKDVDLPGEGTVPTTTSGSVTEKLQSETHSSMGVHAALPFFGLGVGLTKSDSVRSANFETASAVTTVADTTGSVVSIGATKGTLMTITDVKSSITFLDLSYTLPVPLVVLRAGLSLPVAGTSKITNTYTAAAQTLFSAAIGPIGETEEIKVSKAFVYGLFADVGYAFGPFEVFVGLRHERGEATADIAPSPLRLVYGKNSVDFTSETTFYNVGAGFYF